MCFFLEMKSALCGCVGAICLILLNVVNFSGLAFVNLCCGCLWKFVFFIGEWFEKCKQILGICVFRSIAAGAFLRAGPQQLVISFARTKETKRRKAPATLRS